MAVLLRIGNQRAILREGRWRSAHPQTECLLNAATEEYFAKAGGPPVSDRNPEDAIAAEMARRFEGSIMLRVKAKKAAPAYIALRQMRFDF